VSFSNETTKEKMKMLELKYNKWSMQRIKDGAKTLTSRKTKHEHGIEIEDVVGPLPWYFIRDYLYRSEGASSPAELQRIMNQCQRREVDDEDMFYVHIISPRMILKLTEETGEVRNEI